MTLADGKEVYSTSTYVEFKLTIAGEDKDFANEDDSDDDLGAMLGRAHI